MTEETSKSTRNQSKTLDRDYSSQMMERLRKLSQRGEVVVDKDFNARIEMLMETAISEGICSEPETLCLVLGMSSQKLCKVPKQRQVRLTEIRNLCCAFQEQAWSDGNITYDKYKGVLSEWE